MHPHLAAALDRLDAVTADLRSTANSLPPALQEKRPARDRWSVNEVLEHVGIVERLFLTTLIKNVEAAKVAGLTGEVEAPAQLSDALRVSVEDRTSKRTAPERVLPTGTVQAPAALQVLDDAHAELRAALSAAADVTLSAVTMEHRVFGTLNVYQWVDFLAGHERRHLAQVREIAEQVVQS